MKLDLIKKIDTILGVFILRLLSIFRFKKEVNLKKKPKRILCIKFFGFGNLIMISPVLVELKKKYPTAKIDFLTLNQNKGIFENNKNIDNVYYFKFNSIFDVIINSFKLICELRKNKYDILIDFEQFARYSQIISYFIKPKINIGYSNSNQKRDYLLDVKIEYNNDVHTVENFMLILTPFGIKKNKIILPEFIANEIENKIISDYLIKQNVKQTEKIIGIHPGVGVNAKVRMWPAKYFGDLINKILSEHNNIKIIITGSSDEKTDIDNVLKYVKKDHLEKIKFSYELKLKSIPYLIKKMTLFISNDTGPLHIAAAQNVYVIGLYGPNIPKLYGPYTKNSDVFYKQIHCSPCITNFNNKETSCNNNLCMKKITVTEVYGKVNTYLKN